MYNKETNERNKGTVAICLKNFQQITIYLTSNELQLLIYLSMRYISNFK